MAKTREQKGKIIRDLEDKLIEQKSMVFMNFTNVASSQLFALRGKLKSQNCQLKVVKKTLLEKTLEKMGRINLLEKIKNIKTQIALIIGFEDEILPSKIGFEAAKENENFQILGGMLDKDYLSKEQVIELAKIPSRKELAFNLVRVLGAPLSGLINVFEGNIKGLLYILAKAKM